MITGHGDTSHPQSQGDLRNLRLRKKVRMKNFLEEENRSRRRSRSHDRDSRRKVDASLASTATSSTSKGKKPGRHHSIVAELNIHGITSSSTIRKQEKLGQFEKTPDRLMGEQH